MTIPYYKELEKRQEGEGTLGIFFIFSFTIMQLKNFHFQLWKLSSFDS